MPKVKLIEPIAAIHGRQVILRAPFKALHGKLSRTDGYHFRTFSDGRIFLCRNPSHFLRTK